MWVVGLRDQAAARCRPLTSLPTVWGQPDLLPPVPPSPVEILICGACTTRPAVGPSGVVPPRFHLFFCKRRLLSGGFQA